MNSTNSFGSGKNLTDKDVQPADRIGLAAVQLILSKEKDTEATLRAIVCLEWILKHSPACAHARFLLVRLYRLIGEFPPLVVETELMSIRGTRHRFSASAGARPVRDPARHAYAHLDRWECDGRAYRRIQ